MVAPSTTSIPSLDPDTATLRIDKLNIASLRKVIEPDEAILGELTREQILPDALLSITDLDLDLTPDQKARLAREELASIVQVGILFETILMAGFAFQLSLTGEPTGPRFVYALHEIGEETRHSRLFSRLVVQLGPTAYNPLTTRISKIVRSAALPLLLRRPATLDAFVLGGEEVPDLLQRLMVEHPDTDPFVKTVARYHRAEEARHLAFARTTVTEHHRAAGWTDRFAVRWIVPVGIVAMFDLIVQPFVYATVGLPPLRTWVKVRRSPTRVALRTEAARSVLRALVDGGVYARGRIPLAWRRVCSVDRHGEPRSV